MGTFRWSLFDPATDRTVWELEFPSETVWTTVNGFDLAFLTPEGRLSFRSGEDGREFLHVDIPPGNKSVRQLTVIEYPDQYLALTGTAARNFSHFESFGVPVSDQVRRLVDGAMVSIDRGSGEVRWNKPVGAQEVLTQYPKKWPILLMARIVSGRKIDATVIHRHTGETVWRETPTADETGAGIVWIGETQPMRIRLRIGKGAVVLDCRDSLNPGN